MSVTKLFVAFCVYLNTFISYSLCPLTWTTSSILPMPIHLPLQLLTSVLAIIAQVLNMKYLFSGESELEGMLEPVTPTLSQIPKDKRKEFMIELVQEYRKFSPRVDDGTGGKLCDIWDTENLIVVLRKTK